MVRTDSRVRVLKVMREGDAIPCRFAELRASKPARDTRPAPRLSCASEDVQQENCAY
jgi:hypothetical protein